VEGQEEDLPHLRSGTTSGRESEQEDTHSEGSSSPIVTASEQGTEALSGGIGRV
jgi:hypothetical protein